MFKSMLLTGGPPAGATFAGGAEFGEEKESAGFRGKERLGIRGFRERGSREAAADPSETTGGGGL